MQSWDKTKDQFLNSVNSGTYERSGRYKNFFEALFHQILMFRRAFSSQIHTLTQLKRHYTKQVRSDTIQDFLFHLPTILFSLSPWNFTRESLICPGWKNDCWGAIMLSWNMRYASSASGVLWVQISKRLLGMFMTLRETLSGTTCLFTRWKTNSLSSSFIETSTSMNMTSDPSSLNAEQHLVSIWLLRDTQLQKLSFVRYAQISLDCLIAAKPEKVVKTKLLQKECC